MKREILTVGMVLSLTLFASSASYAMNSRDQEQALFWGLVAGNVVDVLQTSQFHARGIGEGNPLFQDAVRRNDMTPIITAKAISLLATYLFIQNLPDDQRVQTLETANMIQWGIVAWNEMNGGGIVFRFQY